jgi:hypothetical protein
VQRYDEMYTLNQLEELITACPELRFLGLGLANIDFSTWASLGPFQVSPVATAYEESRHLARILVSLQNLKELYRFMNYQTEAHRTPCEAQDSMSHA